MKSKTQTGFTLIEMITVLAIFTIMTSIVIFNHNKFTSETILTNMAYEVALSVREAQIYGVSVRSPDGGVDTGSFDNEYGVHFPYVDGGSPDYYLFVDSGSVIDNVFDGGTVCVAGTDECVTPYTLQRRVKIADIQVKPSGSSCVAARDNDLSILFRRPDPEPLFDGEGDAYEFAQIMLEAPDGAVRYVIVYGNGQINVDNASACS